MTAVEYNGLRAEITTIFTKLVNQLDERQKIMSLHKFPLECVAARNEMELLRECLCEINCMLNAKYAPPKDGKENAAKNE